MDTQGLAPAPDGAVEDHSPIPETLQYKPTRKLSTNRIAGEVGEVCWLCEQFVYPEYAAGL
jgi:hypothetical protein